MLPMSNPFIMDDEWQKSLSVRDELEFKKAYLGEFQKANDPAPRGHTRRDIEQLALHNPAVHAAMKYVYRHEMTFEEAMIELVFYYAEQMRQRDRDEVERITREPNRRQFGT